MTSGPGALHMMPMSDLSTRNAPAALVPLSEALERLAATVRPLVETVELHEAAGGTLVEDASAPEDLPARDLALRSGHACFSGDLVGAGPQSPGFPAVPPAIVVPGSAMPFGTDCVLPPGSTGEVAGLPAVFGQAAPGEGVRRRGEDLRRGGILLRAGTRLDVRHAAALVACGLTTVRIARLAAGILDADAPSARLLRALLPSAGISIVARGTGGLDFAFSTAPESGIALTGCFETGASGSRFCLPHDAPVLLPLVYGFLVPLAEHVCGTSSVPVRRRLAAPLISAVGVSDLVLLREANGVFEPVGAGAVALSSLLRATHRAVLPPESEGLPAGAELEAFPL